MKCDWCELELREADRPVRLSNMQPPARVRSYVQAVGNGFAAMARAMAGEEEITLFFHPACWRSFVKLLRGDLSGG